MPICAERFCAAKIKQRGYSINVRRPLRIYSLAQLRRVGFASMLGAFIGLHADSKHEGGRYLFHRNRVLTPHAQSSTCQQSSNTRVRRFHAVRRRFVSARHRLE